MSHAELSQRIPPSSERLDFAENIRTGTVHIACSREARAWIPSTRADVGSQATLGLLSSPCRMLCGIKELVTPNEAGPFAWISGDDFKDDALCAACVRALGDQQWRAFHVDNRKPGD